LLDYTKRMASNRDKALDNLARLVQVVRHDQKLRKWFLSIAHLPTVQRRNEIYAMVERIGNKEEFADLVVSLRLLADSGVFEAACVALREPRSCAA